METRTGGVRARIAVLGVALVVVVACVMLLNSNPAVRTAEHAGVVADTAETGGEYVVTFEDGSSATVPLDHEWLLDGDAPQAGDVVLVGRTPKPWVAAVRHEPDLCPRGGYLARYNGLHATLGNDYIDVATPPNGVIRLHETPELQRRYVYSSSVCAVCLDSTGEAVDVRPACPV